MAHIVIISEEPLLSEVLSDVLNRELGASVTALENTQSLASLSDEQVDLLVTTMPVGTAWRGRMLSYPAGTSRRITAMLTDITQQLTSKTHTPLVLTDVIILQEQNKKLERVDNGTTVDLTEKEQALLLFIRTHKEVSREDILRQVWGFAPDVTTSTLDTHMYRLRQKWRELADGDCIIATDKGYRWHEHCT